MATSNPTNEFQKRFENLNCFQFKEAKDKIIEECMISIQTWNNWWNGNTTPKDIFNSKINQILSQYAN